MPPALSGLLMAGAGTVTMLRSRTPPHLITLILLAGLSPLSLNMFTPSLANIA